MANQPTQVRAWGRLSSVARPAAPTPAPEPLPTVIQPMFRSSAPFQQTQPQQPTAPTSTVGGSTTAGNAPLPAPVVSTAQSLPDTNSASIRSSPTPRGSTRSSSAVPTSATPKAAPVPVAVSPIAKAEQAPTSLTTKTATTTTGPSTTAASMRLASPIPQAKTIKSDIQTSAVSPNSKPTAPPPSPLKLPPSQVKFDPEPEQKIVVVQKTIEKPKSGLGGNGDSQRELGESYKPSFFHNGKQEVSKELETKEMEKHNPKKNIMDSEEVGMRVITIAGENKGAFMELIQSPKKHVVGDRSHLNKNGNPKMRSHGNESESYSTSSDKEGNSKKDKSHRGKVTSSLPTSAFMNSNVQSINNSILYNCSCTLHDPGVHLALSRKPAGGFQIKENLNGHEN